jgi:hypothetical protein
MTENAADRRSVIRHRLVDNVRFQRSGEDWRRLATDEGGSGRRVLQALMEFAGVFAEIREAIKSIDPMLLPQMEAELAVDPAVDEALVDEELEADEGGLDDGDEAP